MISHLCVTKLICIEYTFVWAGYYWHETVWQRYTIPVLHAWVGLGPIRSENVGLASIGLLWRWIRSGWVQKSDPCPYLQCPVCNCMLQMCPSKECVQNSSSRTPIQFSSAAVSVSPLPLTGCLHQAIDCRDRSPCVIAPIIAPTVASCKPTCDRSRRRRSSRVNAVLVTLQPHRGVVVSGVRQWTKLTHVGPGYNWDGWPSSGGYTISGCNHPTRSTQPCIPPGSLNRVPASAGVKAGMSPLPSSR